MKSVGIDAAVMKKKHASKILWKRNSDGLTTNIRFADGNHLRFYTGILFLRQFSSKMIGLTEA